MMAEHIFTGISNVIDEFRETAQCLWEKGWAERNAGNISQNVSAQIDKNDLPGRKFRELKFDHTFESLTGEFLLVTATGAGMRHLAKDPLPYLCILEISEKGNSCRIITHGDNKIKPTSELTTHLAVQDILKTQQREDKTVLHSHVTELIALTQIHKYAYDKPLKKLLISMHPELILFLPQGIGFVPYMLTGTDDLAGYTMKELMRHQITVWEKHVAVSVGRSAIEAFDYLDIVAKSAEIYFK